MAIRARIATYPSLGRRQLTRDPPRLRRPRTYHDHPRPRTVARDPAHTRRAARVTWDDTRSLAPSYSDPRRPSASRTAVTALGSTTPIVEYSVHMAAAPTVNALRVITAERYIATLGHTPQRFASAARSVHHGHTCPSGIATPRHHLRVDGGRRPTQRPVHRPPHDLLHQARRMPQTNRGLKARPPYGLYSHSRPRSGPLRVSK